MSDQITEQEIRRRLVIFLRIPNETWTDVLKLFPRRTLVQKISPVCKRLKNISNQNVNNVHEITEAGRFNEKLEQADPEAEQQVEHLAGNNCQLDSQFRLTYLRIFEQNMAILRHCIELFRGCQLSLYPGMDRNMDSENSDNVNVAFIVECLTRLEPAKPIAIKIALWDDPQLMCLQHPTIWNCNRISIVSQFQFPDPFPMSIAVILFNWLHRQPNEVDGSSDGAGQVRCLIIDYGEEVIDCDWLLNRLIQNFQESRSSKDRRRFVISFYDVAANGITRLDQFERRHNHMTGEVLQVEREMGEIGSTYRLRRCLAEEEANGREFYAGMFEWNGLLGWDKFAVNAAPMVEID